MQSAAAVVLMPLIIFCCVHRSSDSRCFSNGWTTSKISPFPWEIWTARVTQTPSRSVHPFYRAHERDQQTDTQTDHATPSPSIQLLLRCGLIIIIVVRKFRIAVWQFRLCQLRHNVYVWSLRCVIDAMVVETGHVEDVPDVQLSTVAR